MVEWLCGNQELTNHTDIQEAMAPIMQHEILIESIFMNLFVEQKLNNSKGFTADDLGSDLPSEDELKAALYGERVMESARINFALVQKDPEAFFADDQI